MLGQLSYRVAPEPLVALSRALHIARCWGVANPSDALNISCVIISQGCWYEKQLHGLFMAVENLSVHGTEGLKMRVHLESN